MPIVARIAPTLERALLRRGVAERLAADHRCAGCRRTPLVGERIYFYAGDRVRCELCRAMHGHAPVRWELMHGPEWGHAVRLTVRAA
jgi:hypothetical protein